MKVGQILISFSISSLIFLGLFMGEAVRFEFLNSIENPFEKAVALDGEIRTEVKLEEIFTKEGEFFHLYPGSVLDFEKKHREVVEGDIFVSSQFITELDFQKAITNNEFKDKILPKVGQFKVGPVLVSAPGSVMFIHRDKGKKRSKIYAYDRAVNVYLPEGKRPFVIPSGMVIDISDDLITNKTGNLYYTKQKKEFRLVDFLLGFDVDEKSQRPEDRLVYSLDRLRVLRQEVEQYAKNLPQTWLWFRPSSMVGKITETVKKLQKSYALGYPEKKKEERQFEILVSNLVDANYAVERDLKAPATLYVQNFLKNFNGREWDELMVSNKAIKLSWNNFERAQKTWLRAIFPDDIANVFFDIWFKTDQKNISAKLDSKFISIENLIANSYFKNAEEKLIALIPIVEKLKQEKRWTETELADHQIKVTKIRRLLTELLRTKSFFQKKEVFDVYTLLVEKELQLYTDKIVINELRLEVAQDVLFFLKKFLDPETVNPENARALVKFYNYLKVDSIVAGLGRSVFSPEELATVELIEYVGSSGLTKEEITSLRKSKAQEKDLQQRLKQLEEAASEEEKQRNEQALYRKIHDKESLYYFLKSKGIDVSMLKTDELLEDELFRFQDGAIGSDAVSGTFQISQQMFKIIRIGNRTERRLKLRFFDSFIENLKTSKEEEEAMMRQNAENFIPQNSGRVAMERRIMLKFLESEGFSASIKDIESLNKKGTLLKITGILYEKRYKLDFIYSQITGKVQELEVQNGRNTFKFEGEHDMKGLSQLIDKKMLELLDKKREESSES